MTLKKKKISEESCKNLVTILKKNLTKILILKISTWVVSSLFYFIFQRLKVHHKLKRHSVGGNSTAAPGDTGFTAAAVAAARRQTGGKYTLQLAETNILSFFLLSFISFLRSEGRRYCLIIEV